MKRTLAVVALMAVAVSAAAQAPQVGFSNDCPPPMGFAGDKDKPGQPQMGFAGENKPQSSMGFAGEIKPATGNSMGFAGENKPQSSMGFAGEIKPGAGNPMGFAGENKPAQQQVGFAGQQGSVGYRPNCP